jgi:hypothetical protein
MKAKTPKSILPLQLAVAKLPIAGRVSIETIAAVDAYARARSISRSQAVSQLIEAGLKRRSTLT